MKKLAKEGIIKIRNDVIVSRPVFRDIIK